MQLREWLCREDREDFDLKAASEGQGTGGTKRGRPSGGGASADGSISVGKRVYVNNLSHDTTWQNLKDHFRQAGSVVHAAVLTVRRILAVHLFSLQLGIAASFCVVVPNLKLTKT